MRKKGFTLIEVLSIIGVLGIIALIVIPRMAKNTKTAKQEEYEKLIKVIENSAKAYYANNKSSIKIYLSTLQEAKMLTTNIVNPITDEEISGCVRISQDNDGVNRYVYSNNCAPETVTLTVELNDGTTTQTFESTYTEGTKITLQKPTRGEDTFSKWVVTIGDSVIVDNELIIGSKDTTIYALWIGAPTLTVDLNGGTTTQTFKASYRTGTVISLQNPTKSGHIFTGWNVVSGNSTISAGSLTIGSEDTRIKANYTQCASGKYASASENRCIDCSIGSYSAIGASACTPCPAGKTTTSTGSTSQNSCTACSQSNVATWASPTWNPNSVNNLCTIGTCDIGYNLSSNSCGAKTYTISYASDTYTAGTYAPTSATYDDVVRISNPTKPGSAFSGWTVTSGLNSSTAKYGNTATTVNNSILNSTTKITAQYFINLTTGNSVTLKANFSQCEAGTYSSGRSCLSCPTGMTSQAGATSKSDCKITCAAGTYLAKSATSCSDCLAGSYCPGTTCNYSDSSACGITVCTAGKYSKAKASSCTNCAIGTISSTGATECKACQPSGATGTNGTTSAAGKTSCDTGCGKTNVATWKTAAWNNNNPTNICTINTCTTGYKISGTSCVACGVAHATGYSSGCTPSGCDAGYHLSGSTCPANTYTIVFNANNGTGTMSDLSMTYGTAKNLTQNVFTRSGYSFSGWNTKANGSGTSYSDKQSVNNLTTTNGGTVNLYAQWSACGAGTYLNNGSCTACPAGTYSTGSANASCTKCAIGSVPNSNKTGCTACAAGKTTSAAGKTSCDANCTAITGLNTWATQTWNSDNTVSNLCKASKCNAGYRLNNGSCTGCGAGTFSASAGATSCTNCAVGSYSTGSANTGCTACAAGKTTSAAGATASTSCVACSSITGLNTWATQSWSNNSVANLCKASKCNAGYRLNNGSCTGCGAGTFSASAGATSCTNCAVGSYSTGSANTGCTACAAGKTTSAAGATASTSCVACSSITGLNTWATQSWSNNNVANLCKASKCNGGYKLASGSCTACGKGTFSAAGATSCTACAVGTYNNSTASTSCTACTPSGATGTSGTTSGTGKTSCDAGCGKTNVATWKTAAWNNNNPTNVCTINTCASGYEVSGNTCVASIFTKTGNISGTAVSKFKYNGRWYDSETVTCKVYLSTSYNKSTKKATVNVTKVEFSVSTGSSFTWSFYHSDVLYLGGDSNENKGIFLNSSSTPMEKMNYATGGKYHCINNNNTTWNEMKLCGSNGGAFGGFSQEVSNISGDKVSVNVKIDGRQATTADQKVKFDMDFTKDFSLV